MWCCSQSASFMSSKFKRHLATLLRKNLLLKWRMPCSFCCELLLAQLASGLLVMARFLTQDLPSMEVDGANHVDQTMPVRLPECAEYVAVCNMQPIPGTVQGPCIAGTTFGCVARDDGPPGVWVNLGCNATFSEGEGSPQVECSSHSVRPEICWPPADNPLPDFGFEKRRLREHMHQLRASNPNLGNIGPASLLQSFLGSGDAAKKGTRRLDAVFALAPAHGGGKRFQRWLDATGHPWAKHVRLFESAADVQAHMTSRSYPLRNTTSNRTETLCGAVIFDTPPSSSDVQYTIRLNQTLGYDPNLPALGVLLKSSKFKTDSLVDNKQGKDPTEFNGAGITWYTQSGFLALQRTVDAFLENIGSSEGDDVPKDLQAFGRMRRGQVSSLLGEDGRPHVVVPFPSLPFRKDLFMTLMPTLMAFFLRISLSYSVNRLITSVVHEREARLRDGMRMMGMHAGAFYASWIVTYLAIFAFVMGGVTCCIHVGQLLPHASPSMIYVYLMLFAASSIAFSLAITTFFKTAKTAATVGCVAYYTSSFLVFLARPSSAPEYLRRLSLIPTVCFDLTGMVITTAETQGSGIQWSTLDTTSQNFSVFDGFMMFMIDWFLYLILFLYLDQVGLQGDTGTLRPLYFPCMPSFWQELLNFERIQLKETGRDRERGEVTLLAELSPFVERDVGEAAAMMARNGQVVELTQLSKRYGEIHAVDSLDLVMYPGEVFALLGHNGAGKTTTLGMLCSLMPPTSGSCTIFGHDLLREPSAVQMLLGVCPQHDVLWDVLTCEEHLMLFACFKGVPDQEAPQEVSRTLERVGLAAAGATQRQAGHLSGGMRRKLSLGIAFLGGSRLVVLDEPTSGLDPYSRRAVWELIRCMKQGRVTVLSTHYMDEADILGDRIGILHKGRLRCCGSPHFLKRAYDCGYNITFVKKSDCQTDSIIEAVSHHMPELASEIGLLSDSANELMLQLPFAAARHFPVVLASLERQLTELYVESYGVSVTTLEEVFLKVASGETPAERKASGGDQGADSARDAASQPEYIELQESREPARAGGRREFVAPGLLSMDAAAQRRSCCDQAGFVHQFCAFLRKRWRYGIRDGRGLLCQLFLPTGALILALFLQSRHWFRDPSPLVLDARNYNEHCTGHPQNLVDFSHLASVSRREAQQLLLPGRHYWNGDLRHFEPATISNFQRYEETRLTGGLQNLIDTILEAPVSAVENKGLQDVFEWSKDPAAARKQWAQMKDDPSAAREDLFRWGNDPVAAKSGLMLPGDEPFALEKDGLNGMDTNTLSTPMARRLDDASQLSPMNTTYEALLDASFNIWALAIKMHTAARGVTSLWGLPPIANDGRLQRLYSLMGLRQEPYRRLQHVGDRVFVGRREPFVEDFDECISDSRLMMLWEQLDLDHDGRVTKGDLQELLQNMRSSTPQIAMERSEAQLDDLLATAIVFSAGNGRGYISQGDYCKLAEEGRAEVERLYNLAVLFSEQIANSSSECPRYGAYYVLNAGKKSGPTYASADAIVFVNTSSSHAAGAFQAALTNAKFAHNGLQKSVGVTLHLFPQTADEQQTLERVAVFGLSIVMTLCLSFIPAGIAHFVVKERQSGAKQLQALTGAPQTAYWLSNLVYDVALYVVPAACAPLALRTFGFNMLLVGDCGMALAAVLGAFGPAVAGFSYLISFAFKDHAAASNAILALALVGAVVLSIILFVLAVINYDPMNKYPMACDYSTQDHPDGNCHVPLARSFERVLGPFFRLVPTVCVYQALFAIAIVANLKLVLPEGVLDAVKSAMGSSAPELSLSPFAYEWAGEPLRYLCIEAVVFFFATLCLDVALHSPRVARFLDAAACSHRWRRFRVSRAAGGGEHAARDVLIRADVAGESAGDPSVEAERERVALCSPVDVSLHVCQLEKTYQRWFTTAEPKRAVKGVSFAANAGEVFGLLGHNGAGKTSALKCLVGEQSCTAGSVHVGGFHMERDAGKARRNIGYCPQFDALLELLTVTDHLCLYASLKGLPRSAVADAVRAFGLSSIAHRRADHLSGGNKRKLSAAIALIGNPRLAVLDEPSCGLDPAARRALWSAVHRAVAVNTSNPMAFPCAVLLTTHSMEEAEALSTRLGIIAQGEMLVLGTPQQIKQRHGGSHELCFSLQSETDDTKASLMRSLGREHLAPNAPLDYRAIWPSLEANAAKKRAYLRPRCIIRGQIETLGHVEASVFAEWWLQQSRGEQVEAFLSSLLGGSVELVENFSATFRFRLPRNVDVGLPELFRQLEEKGPELGIAEYTLTQATLEQIFNSIAEEVDKEHGAAR